LKAAIALCFFAVLDRLFADPLNFKNEMIQQRRTSSKRRAKKDGFGVEVLSKDDKFVPDASGIECL